jgi:tetratricopeptide (TPR) repeat protein
MPTDKTKKPPTKRGAKTATKAPKQAPAKLLNTKNGKTSKPVAAAPPPVPISRPAPPPDAKSDSKAQYKAFERGIQLFHKRNFREAKEMFQKATEGPSLEVASNAKSHIRMCERRLAAPAPKPQSAEEHYNYGVALMNLRQLGEARRHLNIALEMEPRADHVHYAMGVCLALSGDPPGAYDSLKRAIELQPRNRMVAIQDSDLEGVSNNPRINPLLYPERYS